MSPRCWGLWCPLAMTISVSQTAVTPWRRWPSWCHSGSLPSLSWLLFSSSPSSSGRLGFEREGSVPVPLWHPNPQRGVLHVPPSPALVSLSKQTCCQPHRVVYSPLAPLQYQCLFPAHPTACGTAQPAWGLPGGPTSMGPFSVPPKMLLLLTSPQSLLPCRGLSCSRVSADTPPYAVAPWESCPRALPAGPVPGSPLILPRPGSPCHAVALLSVPVPIPALLYLMTGSSCGPGADPLEWPGSAGHSWAQLEEDAQWDHQGCGQSWCPRGLLKVLSHCCSVPRLRVRKHVKEKTKPHNFLVAATHLKALPSESGCGGGNGGNGGEGVPRQGAGQCPS